jgi:hypothetical protein
MVKRIINLFIKLLLDEDNNYKIFKKIKLSILIYQKIKMNKVILLIKKKLNKFLKIK